MSNKKEELKAKVLEAQSKNDIAALYVLEAQAQEVFDEETLHGFYANILDLALENLTNTLESHQKFNMEDVQGFAAARALYEYAMEHYHAGATKDAAALFEVLSGMTTDDKFSWSLKLHWHAADQGMKLDDFIENYELINSLPKKKTVVCFSETGKRDSFFQRYLLLFGFTNIISLETGMRGWIKAGFPTETIADPVR